MFLSGNAARDENAEMADVLMHSVDYGLSIGPDLVDVIIEIKNPVERLLYRRDVVALRAEHHDRRADITKVDGGPIGGFDAPCRKVVANEQLVNDELDFLGIQVDMATPPALELEIARWFGVDFGIDIILLGPERVGGVLVLEISNQPTAIELAAPGVAGQRRQPRAAEKTTGITHRVFPAHACPIG